MSEKSLENSPADSNKEYRVKDELADLNNGTDLNGTDQRMDELRRLLVGQEGQQIAGLQARINALAKLEERGQVEALGRELPRAIAYHNKDRSRLVNALGATIEETLQVSIRRNPKPFADAIFPAIGPAIRRSIAEALRSVVESMNRAIEHSFSFRSLKWRLEAFRTGTSFTEVMLAHTLNYRVEQMLLIDNQTGLLIHHVNAETVEPPDSDVISSMLSVVQNFMRDSLQARSDEGLNSIVFGDRTLILIPGPQAVLVAVVRGISGPELREVLHEILEAIHLQYGHLLEKFDGDTDPLIPVLSLMRAGLLENFKRKERRQYKWWAILVALLILASIWFFWSFRNHSISQEYLDRLREAPGLVVTKAEWQGRQFMIEGLRDPLASDPASLRPAALAEERVSASWESYLALDSLLIVKRVQKQLDAPESVSLSVVNGVLYVSGKAESAWVNSVGDKYPFVLGVVSVNDDQLEVDFEADLARVIERIEQTSIVFGQGSANLSVVQQKQVTELVSVFNQLEALNSLLGRQNQLQILGYASTEGSQQANLRLSENRAQQVRDLLIEYGMSPDVVSSIGTGDPRLPGVEATEAERTLNRSVVFKVN